MNKTLLKFLLIFFAALVTTAGAKAQPLLFNSLAGSTTPGSSDGIGRIARFNSPLGIAVDSAGTIYIADTQNGTIRKISTNNMVSTIAGLAGNFGSTDATRTNARFYAPQGIAVDNAGNLFVTDTANATIRKITTNGTVSTFAGVATDANSFDGVGTSANFFQPEGIAVDNANTLYVADSWNHTIRKITPAGVVTTLAGLAGYPGSIDGTNSRARFNRPAGIAVDSATNLFVTDSFNHTIRKISSTGNVTTIAGLAGVWGSADGANRDARFFQPQGIVVDNSGNVFVADSGNHVIRKISPSGTNWIVTMVAGLSGNSGKVDGLGSQTRFNFPKGLARNNAGYLFVGDSGNNSIRGEGFALDPIFVLGNGQVYFTWTGKSDVNYVIESSTDLINWTFEANVSSPSGLEEFMGPPPDGQNHFYRARVSP